MQFSILRNKLVISIWAVLLVAVPPFPHTAQGALEEEIFRSVARYVWEIYNPKTDEGGTAWPVGRQYLITNAHVIRDVLKGNGPIYLSQKGRRGVLAFGRLILVSMSYDLALFKIRGDVGRFLRLADDFDYKKEDLLYTVGYPRGVLRAVEQAGPIRYWDDTFYEIPLDEKDGNEDLGGLSGAPILDSRGLVVAVWTQSNRSSAYAVAVKYVRLLLDEQVGVTCRHREGVYGCLRRAWDKMEYLAKAEKNPMARYQLGKKRGDPGRYTLHWLIQSAEDGSYMALITLCGVYFHGTENIPKDTSKASYWCNRMRSVEGSR